MEMLTPLLKKFIKGCSELNFLKNFSYSDSNLPKIFATNLMVFVINGKNKLKYFHNDLLLHMTKIKSWNQKIRKKCETLNGLRW